MGGYVMRLTCGWQSVNSEHKDGLSSRYRHALFPVDCEADGIGADLSACLKMPQRFARFCVERKEGVVAAAAEKQPAGCREQPASGRRVEFEFPSDLAGHWLERFDDSISLFARDIASAAAFEISSGFILGFHFVIDLRVVVGGHDVKKV